VTTEQTLKKIVVTGGSGKAGRAVIHDLLEHGYQVINVDRLPSRETVVPFLQTDLTDLGQTFEVLHGADAVVHLAAIPAPGLSPDGATFENNMASTYNVFAAAVKLGLKRIVWASSETTLGLPFDREEPAYAPIDEAHPLYPESTYALSKILGEEMARQFNRWTGIPIVGLRFSNIMEPHDYQRFPSFWSDAQLRKWNLWSYIDARDVAQSCRLGLLAELKGAPFYIIAAADTVMNRPSRDLMAEVFPNVPLRDGIGEFESLLSSKGAKAGLGFVPQFSWRDHV
jgi:nucleoside-diphosphate-sugar epimerase